MPCSTGTGEPISQVASFSDQTAGGAGLALELQDGLRDRLVGLWQTLFAVRSCRTEPEIALRLVEDPDAADLSISGSVDRLETRNLSLSPIQFTLEYEVTLGLDLEVK